MLFQMAIYPFRYIYTFSVDIHLFCRRTWKQKNVFFFLLFSDPPTWNCQEQLLPKYVKTYKEFHLAISEHIASEFPLN